MTVTGRAKHFDLFFLFEIHCLASTMEHAQAPPMLLLSHGEEFEEKVRISQEALVLKMEADRATRWHAPRPGRHHVRGLIESAQPPVPRPLSSPDS